MGSNAKARMALRCGCGRPKIRGRSLCTPCFKSLPPELQQEWTQAGSFPEREAAYEKAAAHLKSAWETSVVPPPRVLPVTLTEKQMIAIFLAADIEGKRFAVQALLKWEGGGA